MPSDRIIERKLLLKRVFPRSALLQMGKTLNTPYFKDLQSEWDMDYDRAALEIASKIGDLQLREASSNYRTRRWEVFRGQYYTFENGDLRLEGSWNTIQAALARMKRKYGRNCVLVLKCLVGAGNGCSLRKITQNLPEGVDPSPILSDLQSMKVIVISYKSKRLQEWAILEETSPIIRLELSPATQVLEGFTLSARVSTKIDLVSEERGIVEKMDRELAEYLNDLLKFRVDRVITFGKSFSISQLADYLKTLFGPVLYFDSMLSLTQQYGLSDIDIVHPEGRTGMRTGWNLSLFGEPGTGKSFSVRDLILGKPDAKISAHGIPGRNRYAGGMTPARFIRIGQAYASRVFNFIVPEFNDWFKYKGMVEPLKLAMERGEIKYEMHREVIGPYRFNSFFSVNYNIGAFGRGYQVTVQDPNFSAIEDRMLCRLHRLTKQRFVEIAESQMRLAFGEIDIEKGGQHIRDHLALVYAAESNHPLVHGRFPKRPVMLTPEAQETLMKARKAILEEIPQKVVRFSARLEDRALRFACAASLLSYFQTDLEYIPVSQTALNFAIQLYVEEASVRSRQEFAPEPVLAKLGLH